MPVFCSVAPQHRTTRAPALLTHDGVLHVAWKQYGVNWLDVGAWDGFTLRRGQSLETSDSAPSLTELDGFLNICWTGSGDLNVNRMVVNSDLTFGAKITYGLKSNQTPLIVPHRRTDQAASLPLFVTSEGDWSTSRRYWSSVSSLVNNQGFESTGLASWSTYSTTPGFNPAVTATRVHSGSNSLILSQPGIVYQDVTHLSPGIYEVSTWVAGDPGTTANAELSVHDGQGGNFVAAHEVVSEEKFHKLVVTFSVTNTRTARVHLVRGPGSGVVYFDDVLILQKGL